MTVAYHNVAVFVRIANDKKTVTPTESVHTIKRLTRAVEERSRHEGG